VNLIPLLINLIATAVATEPAIPASIAKIVTDLAASVSAIFASGVTQKPDAVTVLAALSGVVAALKANTTISPATLNLINSIDKAIGEALQADASAQKLIDPTALKQEAAV